MVDDERTAKQLSQRLLAAYNDLEKTVPVVAAWSSVNEQRRYREALSMVLTSMVLDVLTPLYERHPHLKPPGWDGE